MDTHERAVIAKRVRDPNRASLGHHLRGFSLRFFQFIQDQASSTPDALGGIELADRASAWL
jgi:hypothetical protein